MAKTDRDIASDDMMHYMRIKRCLESTGKAFVGYCITCSRKFHIEYLQAGHFISGRRNAVLFDVMCIHNQCNYCNVIEHGRHKTYRKIMVAKHGEEWVLNREYRSKRVIKNNQIDFIKLRKGIKRMLEKIYRKHGYRTFGEILAESK